MITNTNIKVNPVIQSLEYDGYFIFKELIGQDDIDFIISHIKANMNDLNRKTDLLLSDGDMANIIYTSKRSNNLYYSYLKDYGIESINRSIQKVLNSFTNLNFSNGINSQCLPVCIYTDQGEIKAHRDIQKNGDLNTYLDYVGVGMLSQQGYDFEKGDFYLNPCSLCSPDGKTVMFDYVENRIYPKLEKGDIIIFDNKRFIHGVETVETKNSKGFKKRITCGFRTN